MAEFATTYIVDITCAVSFLAWTDEEADQHVAILCARLESLGGQWAPFGMQVIGTESSEVEHYVDQEELLNGG